MQNITYCDAVVQYKNCGEEHVVIKGTTIKEIHQQVEIIKSLGIVSQVILENLVYKKGVK